MDFILNLMDSKIAIQSPESSTYVNLLRQRNEYLLFFILAYLWDKHSENIDFGEFSKIIEDLNKVGIGKIVETIRKLDEEREIFVNKKVTNALNAYPNLRNEKHGHGYTVDEKAVNEFVKEMEEIYRVLVDNIPLFINSADIILVTRKEKDILSGIRFPLKGNGMPVRWSCPEQVFNCPEPYISRTFASLESGEYIKLSPFIHLENDGEDRFIFVSLEEKLTGKVKYAQLLRANQIFKEWQELVSIFIVQNKYRRISSNGTIMNMFENNHKEYISIHKQNEELLRHFLLKDKSSVFCTIWGHGGVGKTALIQHVATNLFNQQHKSFEYIIFASAKDRKYNPITGKIERIRDHVRLFEEVIFTISSTLYDMTMEYEQFLEQIDDYIGRIVNHQSKSLIIIDDFETFNHKEQKKLTDFIHRLNLNYHKVVITTRVKHSVIGLEITTSEFDEAKSKDFLLKIIEAEYETQLKQLSEVTNDERKMHAIFKATAGRPIFLYQFVHLYVQHGFREKDFDHLARSESANIFLYERIYDDYLSQRARNLFVYISQIINKDDLSFNATILEYMAAILEDGNGIVIENEMEELSNMLIIVSDSMNIYRVYSEEIVKIMNEYYLRRDPAFRANVAKVIQNIGDTKFDGDIYESLVRKADKSRKSESEESILEQYRKLLTDPRCPMDIKQKAIKNVTGHFETVNKPEQSIEMFNEFYNIFKDDQEVIRLYARLLWNNADRPKACAVLSEYYNNRKKSEPESLVLYFIWVEYQGKLILGRRREEIVSADGNMELITKIRQEYKVYLANFINEFGLPLHDIIKNRSNVSLTDNSLQEHHLTNSVLGLVKSGTELIDLQDENMNRTEVTLNLIRYGLNHLQPRSHKTLRNCLQTIETAKGCPFHELMKQLRETDFQRLERLYKPGDLVDFEITGVQKYGVFGRVDKCAGLLHVSNIPVLYQGELMKNFIVKQVIQVEIDTIDPAKKRFSAKFVSLLPALEVDALESKATS